MLICNSYTDVLKREEFVNISQKKSVFQLNKLYLSNFKCAINDLWKINNTIMLQFDAKL